MAQEKLTLLVAGIGLAGTLLGTLIGALIGFISTFFVQKWQQENERRKEGREIIEKRIDELNFYLNDLMEKCTNLYAKATVRHAEVDNNEFDNALNDLLINMNKAHLLEGFRITEDEQLISLIETIRKSVPEYCTSSMEFHSNDKNKYDNTDIRNNMRNQLMSKYNNIRKNYIEIILRVVFLGLRVLE